MTHPSLLAALAGQTGYNPDSLTVDQARTFIAGLVEPVAGTEEVFIRNALGRALAAPVISPINVPAHDNSAMDGFAMRGEDLAADVPVTLAVVGTAFAGRAFEGTVQSGQSVRIMTGAVVPDGADTIVMQEVTHRDGNRVTIPAGQMAGQNLRRAGEDLAAGKPALASGTLIRPADMGLLASLGIVEVSVRRHLRVAFFSTGDEICTIGQAAAEGQIYDSNRYTLYGMLQRLGCDLLDMGVVKDDPASLEDALSVAASDADVVITSGGVSVGEADFIKELMARMGEVAFWKIAMKPGRPMAFGRIGKAMLFGLPGNPVAVMVTFLQFVRPALLKMMGQDPVPPVVELRLPCTTPLRKGKGRTEFQRGIASPGPDGWTVRATGVQGSGILRSMSEANCFIVLGHDQGDVASGDMVSVQIMDGLV